MIAIVITCDTDEERDEATAIEDWIHDGEFDGISIRIEGPS